jgi:uncharacterized protein (DUF2237 family)
MEHGGDVPAAGMRYKMATVRGECVMPDGSGGFGRRPERPEGRNVRGGVLEACSLAPLTGFYRNGCCDTGPQDRGSHTVCAVMSEAFLAFSAAAGNDLSTPRPEYGFPGLKPGDRWCLCAPRWQEAFVAGHAPKVILAASHVGALAYCRLADLVSHASDTAI